MTLNVPLLTKVLDHITAHPEEHDQRSWAIRKDGCGTACCVAGWAVVMSGHEFAWWEWSDGDVADETVDHELIGHVAQRELGLTYEQARLMFRGDNTLYTLWYLAAEYTHGEITPPAEFA